MDPMSESLVAWWPTKESTVAASGLGGGERLTSTVDGSAMVLEVMTETIESSGVEAGATDAAPVFGAEGPMVPVEQTTLPKVSDSMVGHAIQ